MTQSNKPRRERDSLPAWATEVQPAEDVMTLLYAPTGQPKAGPLIPFPAQQNQQDKLESPAITTPVTGPATTPLTASATRPATDTVTASAARAVTDAATSTTTSPVTGTATAPSTYREPFTYLDATHSGSEQRVYSQMYRHTISKGISERHFSTPELMKMTGIRSDRTVRTALQGLEEKLSIKKLRSIPGDPAGPFFAVFSPKEIIATRRKIGLQIDEKTKRVITAPVTRPATRLVTSPATDPITDTFTDAATESVTEPEFTATSPVNSTAHVLNTKNNTSGTVIVVDPRQQGSDDEKLGRTRNWFEQLAGGGNWKPERDEAAYGEIAHCNQWHILLGLCYSVSRSPEHKMSSLKYAVPAILNHYRDMAEFPESVLAEIAYKTKIKTLSCLATGNWTVAEWELGRE